MGHTRGLQFLGFRYINYGYYGRWWAFQGSNQGPRGYELPGAGECPGFYLPPLSHGVRMSEAGKYGVWKCPVTGQTLSFNEMLI